MDDSEDEYEYYFNSDEEFINFILKNDDQEIIKHISEISVYSLKYESEPFLWPQKSQEELDTYKKIIQILYDKLKKLAKQKEYNRKEESIIDDISFLFTQMRYIFSVDTLLEIISKTKNEKLQLTCISNITSIINRVQSITIDKENRIIDMYHSIYPKFDSYEEAINYLINIEENIIKHHKSALLQKKRYLIQEWSRLKIILAGQYSTLSSQLIF